MLRKNKETGIEPRTSEGLFPWGGASNPLRMFDDMDRWFDDVRREFERAWTAWPGFRTSLESLDGARMPALDLRDNSAEFVVTAEVPGVSKEDLEIEAFPDHLEIRAETRRQKEEKDDGYFYRERDYSGYHRSVPLPAEVVPDKVVANLQNGVLEVRLPKQEPTPAPKAVKVKVQ